MSLHICARSITSQRHGSYWPLHRLTASVSDRIVASVHRNNKDIFISSLGCHHDEVELKRYGLGKYGNRKPDTGSETNVEVLGVSDSEIVSQPPGSAEATATTALQQEKKKNNDENAKVVRFAVTVVDMGEDHKCK